MLYNIRKDVIQHIYRNTEKQKRPATTDRALKLKPNNN